MKVALIGGVQSTEVVAQKLAEHRFTEVTVWGYEPRDAALVSGWVDLGVTSRQLGFEYVAFDKVGECAEGVRDYCPDVLFAVGLSQILPREIYEAARVASIGFHPTALPRGRGRAAIAWLVLNQQDGAATFFMLREGVDDGPILAQEPFQVGSEDDASAVAMALLAAERRALDGLLPALREGRLEPRAQDDRHATWYGRRMPNDGWIDWSESNHSIVRLIRASGRPHPGARTVCVDKPITIWSAEVDSSPIQGAEGRVVAADSRTFSVQAGSGLVRVIEYQTEVDWAPRVGALLGYTVEAEISELRRRCKRLEEQIQTLAELVQRRD